MFAGFLEEKLACGPVVVERRRGAPGLGDDGRNRDPVRAGGQKELVQCSIQDAPANVLAIAGAADSTPCWGLAPIAHPDLRLTDSSDTIFYM
jgi:hypothetical protein